MDDLDSLPQCRWCNAEFKPRNRLHTAYCCEGHKRLFQNALSWWVRREIEAGRIDPYLIRAAFEEERDV